MRAWGLLFVMCILSLTGFSAQLKNIRVSQQTGKTSLFITMDGFFTHKLFTLPNPERVVLDLKGVSLGYKLDQAALVKSPIKQVRSGSLGAKDLRLVFDVDQRVNIRSLPWQPGASLYGIQIELTQNLNKSPPVISALRPLPQLKKGELSHPKANQPVAVEIPHSPSNRYLRDVVVVLDAGHGGKDPGARGPRRSQEKYVVLAITLKLKQLIDRQPGMRAVLTRSGDYYVGLRQRLDKARKYNGDVFVSIHADAFNNPHSNGASVFALSQSGATSEAARWIAEKENYSELGGVNLGDLDDANGVVRSVLIDLSQTATINSGLQMGGHVLGQLNGLTRLHNNKVEQARFVVLKSPDIPSILVETGFISNPREESNLTSPAYQDRLSRAIFQGIKNYFWDNPPHGSRIEAMTANSIHIVQVGDTLPSIAAQYHRSINEVLRMNHLYSSASLKPGQKLIIPSSWA